MFTQFMLNAVQSFHWYEIAVTSPLTCNFLLAFLVYCSDQEVQRTLYLSRCNDSTDSMTIKSPEIKIINHLHK